MIHSVQYLTKQRENKVLQTIPEKKEPHPDLDKITMMTFPITEDNTNMPSPPEVLEREKLRWTTNSTRFRPR